MTFKEYFDRVQEKAGERMDKDAVRHFYDKLMSVMDAVVMLVYRRP